MNYLIRWNDWLYCKLLRFWIWQYRYELVIGNTVGMGPQRSEEHTSELQSH